MTKQQKSEVIRAACVKANPEIVELKFGCAYRVKNKPSPLPYVVNGEAILQTIKNLDLQIIGRPVRLADVLLAINEKKKDWYAFDCAGYLLIREFGTSAFELAGEPSPWNLRSDDLTLQSDDTINFLYELVK